MKLLLGSAAVLAVAIFAGTGMYNCQEEKADGQTAAKCDGKSCPLSETASAGSECSEKLAGKGGCCASKGTQTVSTGDEKSGCCSEDSACCKGKSDTFVSTDDDKEATCSGSGCAVTQAMAKLPKMTYQVGKESTCCDKSAAAMAEKASKPIQFVVASKTFDDKTTAYKALVEETESFVAKFVTPCKCEVSGTTTIAGSSCSCPVEAGQKAKLVKNAMETVKMTYLVGKESVCCPDKAAELAKESGKDKMFVVAGEKTGCELSARMKLAQARYKAAVTALAKNAEEPAAKEKDEKKSS